MKSVIRLIRVLCPDSIKWNVKIVLIVLPFFVDGCAIVTFRDITQEIDVQEIPTLKITGEKPILFVSSAIKFSADGNLSKVSLENQNYYFEKALIQKLSDAKLFSSVKKSVELMAGDGSLYLYPVHSLTVLLFEDSDVSTSFAEKLMRAFSIGFYPQKIKKNLKYEISIVNMRTNERISLVKTREIVVSYTAPLLLIPIDIDSHPFSAQKQSQIYADIIYPTLSELFMVGANK